MSTPGCLGPISGTVAELAEIIFLSPLLPRNQLCIHWWTLSLFLVCIFAFFCLFVHYAVLQMGEGLNEVGSKCHLEAAGKRGIAKELKEITRFHKMTL